MRTPSRLLLRLTTIALLISAAPGRRAAPDSALDDLRTLKSPAAPASAEPHLAVSPEGVVWLSWLEKRAPGGHVFRAARLQGDRWTGAVTIAEGEAFFANWADFPTLLPLGGDRLAAQYLWKTSEETYAYEVRTTFSADQGRTWSPPVVPHRDGTPTEHGFVSLLPEAAGVRAIWLDGRNAISIDSGGRTIHQEEGEAEMTLRTAVIGPDGALSGEALLDPRVCDCCQTAAVATGRGALVAYRDRSADEIRDIALVRLEAGAWSQPEPLHGDDWKIHGCPVNGPSLAAAGDRIAAAWYTAARDTPRVLLALSGDGGQHFGPPIHIDGGSPLGRVSVLLDGEGAAWVAWLEGHAQEALFQLRRVGGDGVPGAILTVARTSAARASGFPRVARSGDRLVFAWTEPGKPSTVRTAVARIRADRKR